MRYHICAIFAVSMLLLFGCAQAPPGPVVTPEPVVVPTPAPSNNTSSASPCSAGNIVQNDNCFASLALEKSNSTYCRSIYAIDKLDACLYHFANSSLDICKQITSSGLRFSCLTANAIANKSEGICNLIDNTESAAACLRKVLPPCMLISDESARSLCIALDKNDFSTCKDDACLAGFALNKSSELACGAITKQNDRYYCLALVKKSVGSCLEAPLVPIQDSCIEQASEALDDVSGCGLATNEGTYQNNCFMHFAVERNNATICQQVASETNRDACYKNYSIGTATVGACPKIMESTNRVDCYLKAAKLNRKPSLCNPLGTNDLMNICYSGAILYPAEGPLPDDCPEVSVTEWRDKCYYQAARATYNGTLCGLMTDGASDKRNCLSLFN